MHFKSIYSDRKKCKHFTGLFPEQFDSLFKFLGPAKYCLKYWGGKKKGKNCTPTKIKNIGVREQLFLTLVRLRRGFTLLTMAYFFVVSEFTVRRIFTTWIMFLYYHFKDYHLLMFPDRNAFSRSTPSVFRYFKNIRCIVDCTEFFVRWHAIMGARETLIHHTSITGLISSLRLLNIWPLWFRAL